MSQSDQQGSHGFVIFAKNIQRVSGFYQKTLGLEVSESAQSHEVLVGLGIELVIHGIPAAHAKSIVIKEPPESRNFAAIKPAFHVDDLEAVRMAVEANGGYLKPLKDAWDSRGVLVLDGWDPEGNIVQFKQRKT